MNSMPVFVLLLLALLLRLVRLGDSFWLDEAAQVLESARPWAQQLEISGDFQPPLMHLLTFVSIRLANVLGLAGNEALLRLLPSVIPGLITVWAVYQIAHKLAGQADKTNHKKPSTARQSATLAALLLATSTFHIYYSQELRPYSLPTMWAMLSLLVSLTWSDKRSRYLFILFSIAGLYSSYLYPFFFLGQLAFLLVSKQAKLKNLLPPLGVVIIAFTPWLPSFLEQLRAGQALRQAMPGWEYLVSTPQAKALLLPPLKFIFGPLDVEPTLVFLLALLAVLGLTIYLFWPHLQELKRRPLTTAARADLAWLVLLLLPLLSAWLVSFLVPVLQPKRVLFLLPILLIWWTQLAVAETRRPKLGLSLIILLFAINLWSLIAYWYQPQLQREPWRELIGRLETNVADQKTVAVFAFDQPFAPWVYYQTGAIDQLATGSLYLPDSLGWTERSQALNDYQQVLLFDYLRNTTDPNDQLPSDIKAQGFTEAGLLDYPNIGFVRIYNKESTF